VRGEILSIPSNCSVQSEAVLDDNCVQAGQAACLCLWSMPLRRSRLRISRRCTRRIPRIDLRSAAIGPGPAAALGRCEDPAFTIRTDLMP
jgi:hypothetical protein